MSGSLKQCHCGRDPDLRSLGPPDGDMSRYDHIVMQASSTRLCQHRKLRVETSDISHFQADTRTHAAPCIDSASRSYVGAARNLGDPPPHLSHPPLLSGKNTSLPLQLHPLGAVWWVARVLAFPRRTSRPLICAHVFVCLSFSGCSGSQSSHSGWDIRTHPASTNTQHQQQAAPAANTQRVCSSNCHSAHSTQHNNQRQPFGVGYILCQ